MNNIRTIKGGVNLNGKVKVPGDKSISHRALIIGSIAKGETTIEGFLHCLLYTSDAADDP